MLLPENIVFYILLLLQAFGVPDPKVGEEICVFIRPREGVTLTEDGIREYCKDKVHTSFFVDVLSILILHFNIQGPFNMYRDWFQKSKFIAGINTVT